MDPLTFYLFARITMTLGFAFAIADMASTVRALYHGGREANIGWRYVMEHWGMVAFMLGRVIFGQFVVWLNVGSPFKPFSWWAVVIPLITLAVLAYVVRSNWIKGDALREKARSEYR